MKWKDAFAAMKNGYKIRRKGWSGFWFIKGNCIYIKFRYFQGIDFGDFKTIALLDTDSDIDTLEHTAHDDWEIVEE